VDSGRMKKQEQWREGQWEDEAWTVWEDNKKKRVPGRGLFLDYLTLPQYSNLRRPIGFQKFRVHQRVKMVKTVKTVKQ
jgi:hypothetical protein